MKSNSPILISSKQSLNLFNISQIHVSILDLILANRKNYFKHSTTFETGISDDNHLIHSMLKANFKKEEPKIYNYRD